MRGENVAQALQFVRSRSAELGIVAWSDAKDIEGLTTWQIPEDLYDPPVQQLVILRPGRSIARAFVGFLQTGTVRGQIETAGYGVP